MQVYNPPLATNKNVPYLSDALNAVAPGTVGTESSYGAGRDNLTPFSVREDVTIDGVWFHRAIATAADVYVGIYDSSLALLTACAVDADTTVGFHVVSTAAVTLVPNRVYYMALNQSVEVVSRGQTLAAGFEDTFEDFSTRPDMVATPSIATSNRQYYKARANAALLANAVLSGWTISNMYLLGGFVKQ